MAGSNLDAIYADAHDKGWMDAGPGVSDEQQSAAMHLAGLKAVAQSAWSEGFERSQEIYPHKYNPYA